MTDQEKIQGLERRLQVQQQAIVEQGELINELTAKWDCFWELYPNVATEVTRRVYEKSVRVAGQSGRG